MDALPGASAIELKFNEAGDAQKFPRIHWIDGGEPRDFQKAMEERRAALREELDALKRQTENLRRQGTQN